MYVPFFPDLSDTPVMGNVTGTPEGPQAKEGKTASAPLGSAGPQNRATGQRLPVPPGDELEERFNAVLVSWDMVGGVTCQRCQGSA